MHCPHVYFLYVVKMLCVGLSLEPCFDIDYGHNLPESEIPEYVQRYCCDIKMRYVEQPVLPESDWPPTLGGQYIRLALIKQGRTTRDFTHRAVVELQEDYVRGKYDKILQRKTEIEVEDIFDPIFCDGGYRFPQLKMLIDGAPGVGKTTLSRNISQKWAKGEFLQEYWLILLLHLRERNISRAQTIDDFFYHDDQIVQTAVVTFVKETSGRGVLVIFDGFDELSLTQRREQSLFLDIIKGKILSKCAVVVTSRPYASRPVQELWKSVNRHIEVLGFTNEQIHKCIKQRINDEAKAEELVTEFKDRLDIASICQIPLNCSIVLYVYEMEGYRLPDTLTELYELFILHGLRRYATRTHDANVAETLHEVSKLPRPVDNYFNVLSKLAYDGLKEDKLVFERGDLEVAFSPTFTSPDLPVLDLMTSAKSYSSRGTHDTYSFLHLTIQEYLCAFWAAKYLSDSEKLDFLRENLKNERFYMVLWFFAGITKLNILNVHSVFNKDLWEYNNHVHICHLLYESDSKSHSLCSYVANNCILKRDIHVGLARKAQSSSQTRKYSKFDCLMIAHFLAYSSCHWKSLTLNLDDVQLFHKMFNRLKSCHTCIEEVIVEVDDHSIASFHGELTNLLNEIPQFGNIIVKIKLTHSYRPHSTFQTIKSSFKDVLMNTNALKSIYIEVLRCSNKRKVIRNIYEATIEGIVHSSSLISKLELRQLALEDFMYLLSLLIKWNSYLKLVTLLAFKNSGSHGCDNIQCHEYCSLLSKFLSKNTSLRQISVTLPFDMDQLMSYIDTIQSGLNQNCTLEDLTINKEIIFQRNKHTSKFEVVKDRKRHQQSNQPDTEQDDAVTVQQCTETSSQLGTSSIQTQCAISSRAPCMGDDVDSFRASPLKRVKVGNSSEEGALLTHHVQHQLNPHQFQPPTASSSSHLPTLLHSLLCAPSHNSHCTTVTVSSQLQPSHLRARATSSCYSTANTDK